MVDEISDSPGVEKCGRARRSLGSRRGRKRDAASARKKAGKKRFVSVVDLRSDHRCSLTREAAPRHRRRAATDRSREEEELKMGEEAAETEGRTKMNGEE